MNLFLNCTAHQLNELQMQESKNISSAIRDLNRDNPELFNKLVQAPSEIEEIQNLLLDFQNYLFSLEALEYSIIYLHFPIGSPFFMALFFKNYSLSNRFQILFSHSERISNETQKEESTIKVSEFQFKKYIPLPC